MSCLFNEHLKVPNEFYVILKFLKIGGFMKYVMEGTIQSNLERLDTLYESSCKCDGSMNQGNSSFLFDFRVAFKWTKKANRQQLHMKQ